MTMEIVLAAYLNLTGSRRARFTLNILGRKIAMVMVMVVLVVLIVMRIKTVLVLMVWSMLLDAHDSFSQITVIMMFVVTSKVLIVPRRWRWADLVISRTCFNWVHGMSWVPTLIPPVSSFPLSMVPHV